MGYDVQRFKDAQKADFDAAVAELRAGRKQSHWIWYVFPQLRGLGSSPYAVHYGLAGIDEARAFLRDPLLRTRYRDALAVVHQQAVDNHVRLERLMGAHIDALKLVSSLTLFEHVAGGLNDNGNEEAQRDADAIGRLAGDVLRIAATQGFRRCAFTDQKIAEAAAR